MMMLWRWGCCGMGMGMGMMVQCGWGCCGVGMMVLWGWAGRCGALWMGMSVR